MRPRLDPQAITFDQTDGRANRQLFEVAYRPASGRRSDFVRFRSYVRGLEDPESVLNEISRLSARSTSFPAWMVFVLLGCVLAALAYRPLLIVAGALFVICVTVGTRDGRRLAKLRALREGITGFEPPWVHHVHKTAVDQRKVFRGRVHVLADYSLAVEDVWGKNGRFRKTAVSPFAVVEADGSVLVVRPRTAPRVLVGEANWASDSDDNYRFELEDGMLVEVRGVPTKRLSGRAITIEPKLVRPLPPVPDKEAMKARLARFLDDENGHSPIEIRVLPPTVSQSAYRD